MRKYTIGRNYANDIVISDKTDIVSRKQAILTVSFWGKMVIYDISTNGTYVNGERLANGKGCRVTRKDKVTFANISTLDWKLVKDPYGTTKKLLLLAFILLSLAIGCAIGFAMQDKTEDKDKERTETVKSTDDIAQPSNEELTGADGASVTEQKVSKKKKRNKSKAHPKQKEEQDVAKEVLNSRTDKNTPIIY